MKRLIIYVVILLVILINILSGCVGGKKIPPASTIYYGGISGGAQHVTGIILDRYIFL
jgi:hypothetical protein